jgi:hypothetical protein
MEATKFPADFDAVIAGAPANWQTHLHAWDMNVATTAIKTEGMFMTPGKLATLHKAVLAPVRHARWSEGWNPQRSAQMQLRPERASL